MTHSVDPNAAVPYEKSHLALDANVPILVCKVERIKTIYFKTLL